MGHTSKTFGLLYLKPNGRGKSQAVNDPHKDVAPDWSPEDRKDDAEKQGYG
jgi:hypothetical protein